MKLRTIEDLSVPDSCVSIACRCPSVSTFYSLRPLLLITELRIIKSENRVRTTSWTPHIVASVTWTHDMSYSNRPRLPSAGHKHFHMRAVEMDGRKRGNPLDLCPVDTSFQGRYGHLRMRQSAENTSRNGETHTGWSGLPCGTAGRTLTVADDTNMTCPCCTTRTHGDSE